MFFVFLALTQTRELEVSPKAAAAQETTAADAPEEVPETAQEEPSAAETEKAATPSPIN